MKKMIFALIALVMALPMVAQERVNRAKARWIGEGEKITNVMGWGYDDTAGEWVGCANVIETKVSNKKYTNSDYWKSHTYNNIISIQLKKLEYQGDTLLILVREFWDGGYKYPRIKEDWEHWKSTAFMIQKTKAGATTPRPSNPKLNGIMTPRSFFWHKGKNISRHDKIGEKKREGFPSPTGTKLSNLIIMKMPVFQSSSPMPR